MTVTRKALERMARELRDVRPNPDAQFVADRMAYLSWRECVIALSNALNDHMGLNVNGNRRFNRERFYAAAGLEDER